MKNRNKKIGLLPKIGPCRSTSSTTHVGELMANISSIVNVSRTASPASVSRHESTVAVTVTDKKAALSQR